MLNDEVPAPTVGAEEAGTAPRCAVLGSPISHSLSPVIHRAAYAQLGLDWRYTAHEVAEDQLAGVIAVLGPQWRGLSLTMPLKRVVLDLASEVSPTARKVGAANTLTRTDAGRWHADNTDVPGVVAALGERSVAVPTQVCLWGGGATAASVLAAMGLLGAGESHVHARSAARATPALAVAETFGHAATYAGWEISSACHTAELVVNTAPSGAMDTLAAELASGAGAGRALFDVLYEPWPTSLAAAWSRSGAPVVGGLDLLIHQAAGQIELMTGQTVPIAVLRSAAEHGLAARAVR